MLKISRKEAKLYGREGVSGFNYKFPNLERGYSILYAEFTKEHGERRIGKRPRIYYILDGEGEYVINGKRILVKKDDIISIPPYATYNYRPITSQLKVLLFMDFLDN